jgi:hypothetical protein
MSGPIPAPNESARNTALRKFSDATPNLPGTLRVLIGLAAATAGTAFAAPLLPNKPAVTATAAIFGFSTLWAAARIGQHTDGTIDDPPTRGQRWYPARFAAIGALLVGATFASASLDNTGAQQTATTTPAGDPVLPTSNDPTVDGVAPGLVSAITTSGVTVQVPTAGFIAMTSAVDAAAKTGTGAPDSWTPDPAANSMWQVSDSSDTQITAVALLNSASGSAAFTARVDLVDGVWTYTFVADQTPSSVSTTPATADTVESQE